MPRDQPRLMPFLLSFVAAVLALDAAIPARAQTQAPLAVEQLQWLGWPENLSSVFSAAISDSGQIVISGNRDSFVQGGFLLDSPGQWEERYATENRMVDVNDSGRAGGWVSGRPLNPDSRVHAFYWEIGEGGQTSEVQEPATADGARAVGIDEAGTLYGTVILDQNGARTLHPFRWGTSFDVVTSVSGVESMASNDNGQIALRMYTESGYVLQVLEPDDSVFQLPIPTYPWTYPNDINLAGHMVGDAENEDLTVDEAFLWDGETYTILPRPGAYTQADAEAINDYGQVVGWGWDGSLGALVWDSDQAYDLSVLASETAGGTVRLVKAYDVSNLGWVVGWGYPNGASAPQIFVAQLGRGCPDPDSGEGTVAWSAGEGDLDDPANWETAQVPGSNDVLLFADLPGTLNPIVHFNGLASHQAAVIKTSAELLTLDLAGHTWNLGRDQPCLPALQTRNDSGDFSTWYVQGGTVAARGTVDLRHGGLHSLSLREETRLLVEQGPVLLGHADTTFVFLDRSTLNANSRVILGPIRGERAQLGLFDSFLITPRLTVGGAGWGRVDVDQADLRSDDIVLGDTVDGVGTLIVDAPDAVASTVTADQIGIGFGGQGRLEILGGDLTTSSLRMGEQNEAEGGLRVVGPGRMSTLFAQIGVEGRGLIDILGGASFTQGAPDQDLALDLGVAPGAVGNLYVAGETTRASLHDVALGVEGTGQLEVEGALVEIRDWIVLGAQSGGEGHLLASGGALVDVDSMAVAPVAGAVGEVVVEDALLLAKYLEVGSGGSLQGGVLNLERVDLDNAPKRSPLAAEPAPALHVQSLLVISGATVAIDSVAFGTGWTLSGDGTVPFDLVNNSRLDPGVGDEPGDLRVGGTFTQTPEGVLHLDVQPPEDLPVGLPAKRTAQDGDRLVCDGPASLAGVLEIDVAEDVKLELGDRISVLEAPSVNGGFDEVRLPAGMEADVAITPTGLELVVTATPVAVSWIDLQWDPTRAGLVWGAESVDAGGEWVVEGSPDRGPWRILATLPRSREASLTLNRAHDDLESFRVHWHDESGQRRASSRIVRRTEAPVRRAVLSPVHPNPLNPRASLSLRVDRTGPVRVRVVDLRGRTLAILHEGLLDAGDVRRFVLDGAQWASGVYVVEAEGPGFHRSRKFTLVK